jgi:hypothetical protein
MQIFTQGIKAQTRMLLNTSIGGTMKTKSNVEVKNLVENMAQNEYENQNDRVA